MIDDSSEGRFGDFISGSGERGCDSFGVFALGRDVFVGTGSILCGELHKLLLASMQTSAILLDFCMSAHI